jgi:hypothetical protein
MGQYHLVVNLDKKEYIHAHRLGNGLKLFEQIANCPGTAAGLLVLLACSNGRGGGDLDPNPIIGHWAGDRIAVIGDYAEPDDLPGEFDAAEIYHQCCNKEYRDVSAEVAEVLGHELGLYLDKNAMWQEKQPA